MGELVAFDVEPADLEAYGKQVGRAADDMQAAKGYAQSNTEINWYDLGLKSLISGASGAHETVVQNVAASLKTAESILRASAGELAASAKYYRETDRGNAAGLDAQYPASNR
jgi:hypothetical protein